MRRVSTLLVSTSIGFALCAASPAFAQNPPPPPPADQAADATAQNTQAGTPGASGEEIVVTGLRRSLQSARNIKRNSVQQIDAVVAEDIGKLPDITVSDTAARIPGIQVERSGGEASRVLLRGLDNTYYTTTYNGREIFTAETRSVALQDFPAGAIQAIEAFKTSTANLVEPGIAGLLNVRSRRPFDFSGFEVNGSVWGNYPRQSRDPKPNAQLMLTDRWHAGDSEFGALINFSYTRLHYQDSIRRHGFFIADLAGHRSPDWPEISYGEGDRWRPSINGALQWRNGNLELYAEGLWQGYREEVSDHFYEQPLWSCGRPGIDPGAATYSNIVVDSNNHIVSGSVLNGGCLGASRGFQGATKRHTDTYQFAVGGRYDAGPLLITGDLARTDSKFKLRAESVDFYINRRGYTVNWFTGEPGGPGLTFDVVGLDFTDPANYNYRGFFERYEVAKGDDWQGRLDAEYAPRGLDWLPKIQAGIRYTDRDASRTDGERYWDANDVGRFNIPISAVPLDYHLFSPAFHGDDHRPFPTTWLAPTFNSVWDNLIELRQFNVTRGIPLDPNPTRSQNNDTNPPAIVPTRSFNINEKTLAGYGQLNFNFNPGSMAVDGVIGLRVVRTRDNIRGTRVQPNTAPVPVDVSNHYTDWLPNFNANIHFNRELQLRLAATKTITRPLYEQLNPALSLGTPPPPSCNPATTNCVITGSGGNPFLKPLKSNNYDASLEYYFSRTGFASVAAFRRDMRGFIVNRTFEFPTPDPSGFPIEITGPVNTNKGRIQGFEGQITTFFDWDWVPSWARAFGAQANVTYIDAKIDLPLFCPGDVSPCVPGPGHGNATQIRTRIPDVSKWTFNLVAMYERGPITARLSYNHRSSYPEGPLSERDGFFTLQGRGNPHGRLDWSSSYNVNDHFTVFFDWINILNNPFKSDIVRVNYAAGVPSSPEIFPMVVRFEESLLSGGIRFRFGGGAPRPAAPPPVMAPPPPPPPVAAPPPQPAPPPPPPPAPAPERG
jgi:TonB-dependent receptor